MGPRYQALKACVLPLHYTRVNTSYKNIKSFNSTRAESIQIYIRDIETYALHLLVLFVKIKPRWLTIEISFINLDLFIKPLLKLTALKKHFTSLSFFTASHPSLREIRDNKLHNDGSQVNLCSADVQIMSRFGAQAAGMDAVMQAL